MSGSRYRIHRAGVAALTDPGRGVSAPERPHRDWPRVDPDPRSTSSPTPHSPTWGGPSAAKTTHLGGIYETPARSGFVAQGASDGRASLGAEALLVRWRPHCSVRLSFVAAVLAVGCATVKPEPAPSPPGAGVSGTVPAPPATAPTAPTAPSPVDALAAAHRQKAEGFERAGDLRPALDQWKIVLTIKPDDQVGRAGRARVMGRIEQTVAAETRQAREASARGNHDEARRHLLAALALDPANKAVFDGLRTEIGEVRLAALEAEKPAAAVPAQARSRRSTSTGDGARDDTGETNPVLVEAREAFDKGQYAAVLADTDRLLATDPRNPEAMDLQKAALYRQAKLELDQKNDEESVRTLARLAKLDPGYEDSGALLTQTKGRLAQKYYADGIRLFREEKLAQAIAQWRTALEYDPGNAAAKKNIEQAEKLRRALEERQQGR